MIGPSKETEALLCYVEVWLFTINARTGKKEKQNVGIGRQLRSSEKQNKKEVKRKARAYSHYSTTTPSNPRVAATSVSLISEGWLFLLSSINLQSKL